MNMPAKEPAMDSALPIETTHNSGEGDPSVMAGYGRADTNIKCRACRGYGYLTHFGVPALGCIKCDGKGTIAITPQNGGAP